jgi:transposase
VVAALRENKVFADMMYTGTMNSELFEIWWVEYLLPQCRDGDVVVLDNARFHRKSRLIELARCFEISVWFLPPYSPQLNPIEKFWANLKRFLRNYLPLFCNICSAVSHYIQLR